MKFTNVKQLIIKFMGGGLINFPTRFLRWVKINGDTDDSDDGGESGSGDILDSWPWNGYPKPLGMIFSHNNGSSDVDDWYWNGCQEPINTTIYDVNDINWDLIQEHYVRGNGLSIYLLYDTSLVPVDDYPPFIEVIGKIGTGPLEHTGYTPSSTEFRIGNATLIATVNGKEYGIVYFGE